MIFGCAVLAVWRALALPGNRAAWLLIGVGLASWGAGDVWWVIHEEDDSVPIPSLADWLFFGMYAPFAVAIVLLARDRMGSAGRMLALDGLIGAFAVGALSAALVLEPVLDNVEGDTIAMAVTIAFPVCDIVLAGLLVEAVAMGLACAAGIAVIVRMVATFRENLVILADARREAVTDALTGLGNRRRLLADLERRADGGRLVIVLVDLNGFKNYNDTFGHAAGDALLARLGTRLAAATDAHGRAYRMGGDEFCVLLEGAIGSADASELVAGALCEQGEGFAVDASCGTVELPREAAGAVEALRLADARMYERKRRDRPSAEEQGVALLLRLLSERDPQLGDHVNGVAELAAAVAERLELPAAEREDIRSAAALHDIGKLAIPDSILAKPGPLDAAEWEFMRRHTLIGERILGATPGLAGVAALVRSSHERLDGEGYPDRHAGGDIPLGARIVAVCDAYDAMISDRPYRRAKAPAQALAELRAGAGTQFDAAVVEAFAAVLAARPVAVG